ncbi:TolC family protein [Aquimarina aggregata]|uniref:TolC family protein n=1 Tax=Aquimarina aggregata TaxID=1642818 RepID=UPI0024939B15|nr:TolC family protein [Aquimarina aggregata]
MKKYIFYVLVFNLNMAHSQENLDIEKAINLALINSELYKKAEKELDYSEVHNTLFKKSFLPNIYTSSVFPSISKSVTRITTPNGNDIFVNQNQAYYDLRLNIEQKEPLFGGKFTLSSFFNRIDLFADLNSQTYFSTPFSFSYTNTNFTFNAFKYEKIINQLKIEEDVIKYNSQLEDIVYQTVEKYLEVYTITKNIEEKRKALKGMEEIYSIAEKRFKIGSINKGDLLSLKLRILDIESSIEIMVSEQKNVQKILVDFTKNESATTNFIKPKEDILNLNISYESALSKMIDNNQLMKELKRKKIEKELEIKTHKSENKFSININASYGLSNTASSFNESTTNLQDQQSYSISLRYLLFDFGKNKQQIKLLNIEKELLENDFQIAIEDLKKELFFIVSNYNSNIRKLSFLKKKLDIVYERYNFSRKRFSLGKITITDLNLAQKEYQQIDNECLTTLKNVWINYYNIRKFTMYDFLKNKNINYW